MSLVSLLTQDRFNLTATSGLLLPDQRVNVMVEFLPLDGRLSSMRLTLRIGTGTQNLKVGHHASTSRLNDPYDDTHLSHIINLGPLADVAWTPADVGRWRKCPDTHTISADIGLVILFVLSLGSIHRPCSSVVRGF